MKARDLNGLQFEVKLVLAGPHGDLYVRAPEYDDDGELAWRDPSAPGDVVFTKDGDDDSPRIIAVDGEWYCDGCEPPWTDLADDYVWFVEPGMNDDGFTSVPECAHCGRVHDWVGIGRADAERDGLS